MEPSPKPLDAAQVDEPVFFLSLVLLLAASVAVELPIVAVMGLMVASLMRHLSESPESS